MVRFSSTGSGLSTSVAAQLAWDVRSAQNTDYSSNSSNEEAGVTGVPLLGALALESPGGATDTAGPDTTSVQVARIIEGSRQPFRSKRHGRVRFPMVAPGTQCQLSPAANFLSDMSVASAVKWLQRWREERSAAPKSRGGSVSPLEEFAAEVMTLIIELVDDRGHVLPTSEGRRAALQSRSVGCSPRRRFRTRPCR
jgi:hypothetical protein